MLGARLAQKIYVRTGTNVFAEILHPSISVEVRVIAYINKVPQEKSKSSYKLKKRRNVHVPEGNPP